MSREIDVNQWLEEWCWEEGFTFKKQWESIHSSLVTKLCAEHWCCLSSFLGYWTQSWTGRHSDTGHQHGGTHFADLRTMTGRVNPIWY